VGLIETALEYNPYLKAEIDTPLAHNPGIMRAAALQVLL